MILTIYEPYITINWDIYQPLFDDPMFFPTFQVKVVRFYVRCAAPPLAPPSPRLSPDLICQLLIAVIVAGHHLPALDRSGSSPDLILPALDRSGRRRTFSATALDRSGPRRTSTWKESERCGPRRTSTGEIRRAVGLAGL